MSILIHYSITLFLKKSTKKKKICNGQKHFAEDYIKSSGVAPSRQLPAKKTCLPSAQAGGRQVAHHLSPAVYEVTTPLPHPPPP
jgi:hypothetical protein